MMINGYLLSEDIVLLKLNAAAPNARNIIKKNGSTNV
tara:strand:- start:3 stop:113 length:111 start_codon:yes stop_codon:yes gene_type:complete